jgi:hypothetical protein
VRHTRGSGCLLQQLQPWQRRKFGREVLNPAGADLTPAVAAQLGLRKYQYAWVSVRMPWLQQ